MSDLDDDNHTLPTDHHATPERRRAFPEAPPAVAQAVSILRMRYDAEVSRYREIHARRDAITEGQASMLDVARGHLSSARGYLGMDGHQGFERSPSLEMGTRCLAWGAAYMDVVDGLYLAESFVARFAEIRALAGTPSA